MSRPDHKAGISRAGRAAGLWSAALVFSWAGLLGLACEKTYSRGDCDPGYLKVDGRCELAVGGACSSNGNCLSNICLTSDSGTRFCSIACKLHEDCPTGFYCTTWSDRRCYPGQRPPPCEVDSDCAACETCLDGACVPEDDCRTCQEDAECQGCERCEGGACIGVAGCTPCQQDADCPTCERCGVSGSCIRVSGCLLCAADADCPGCTFCDRGACMPIDGCGIDPCFNDSDCPQRTRCLTDAGSGLNVCLPVDLPFGADCSRGGDESCAGGICIEEPGTGSATCSDTCIADADCPDLTSCLPDDACRWACRLPDAPPPGPLCDSNRDCAAGRVCGLVPASTAGTWTARCVDPLPCAADDGQGCAGGQNQGRCRSGICTAAGLCSPVCAADLDCPIDLFCGVLTLPLPDAGTTAPFRGCSPAGAPLAELGEACPGGDADCREGACLPGEPAGPRPICGRPCDPALADCPDRFVCGPLGSGPTGTWCQPALAQGGCSSDGDCPPELVCAFSTLTGLSACTEALPDGAEAGALCSGHDRCKHGFCLAEGRCAAPCAGPEDCADDQWCDLREWVRSDGGRMWLRTCSPDPGSMTICRRDGDCPAGEVCRPEIKAPAGGFDGRCGPPSGEGAFLSPCQTASDCARGFCLVEGFCSSLCQSDEDCPDDSPCALFWLPAWQGTDLPLAACAIPPAGLGEPCPDGDGDCQSGICYQPAEGEAYCSSACSGDEDCSQVAGMSCLDDGLGGLCRFPTP